jgi:hypothetical protein
MLAVLVIGTYLAMFTACEREGPAERAGETIDEIGRKTGEALEETGEKAKDAAK